MSKGGNYLLNVGPMADGTIPPQSINRLKAIGQWMDVNGDAIYGTTASPYGRPKWGRYTNKSGRLYAHVFQWPEESRLSMATGNLRVSKAYLLADKNQNGLPMEHTEEGLAIVLPSEAPDSIASVIVLECDGAETR